MIEDIHVDFPFYGYRRIYQHLLRKDIRENREMLLQMTSRALELQFQKFSNQKTFKTNFWRFNDVI